MNRWVALILWLLLAMPLLGVGKKWTEAESMGFAGPIKAVSTTYQTFMQQPAQPDGPAIIYQLSCGECEFDREGNQVRSGWMDNGRFTGNVRREVWDGLAMVPFPRSRRVLSPAIVASSGHILVRAPTCSMHRKTAKVRLRAPPHPARPGTRQPAPPAAWLTRR